MPPVKPNSQVVNKKLRAPIQGQGLRKLRALLQRWWQEHSLETSDSRDYYLSRALLFGSALYLSREIEVSFDQALSTLQGLWPPALAESKNRDALLADSLLQKQFLALAKHRLLDEIFISPLCPSFIYEAFSFEERRRSKDLLQDEKKLIDARHLISFTQVYTPAWVVDHLLQDTLGQALSECSQLHCLQNITLLDPALGGGVFLVQALASYCAAYQKLGLTVAEATEQSLKNNLFGLDIDPFALATADLSIILKAFSLGLSHTQIMALLPLTNLCLIDNEGEKERSYPLGSLSKDLRKIQGHPLNKRYDVVVANPPYIGRKLLPRPLKEKLRLHYPDAASDLSQAFLSMALDLAKPEGSVGFITQGSFLHLASAKSLRAKILQEHQLVRVVDLGPGVFPLLAGEKACTALIVIKNSRPSPAQRGHFISLLAQGNKSSLLQDMLSGDFEITRKQSDFLKDPDCVINYLRPPVVMDLRARLAKLADIAIIKQGLATTDNARFLRYIWEVKAQEIPERFVPYARGEGSERWWSPMTTVVLWQDKGRAIKEAVTAAYPYLKGNYAWVVKNEDYYFRGGLTFSFVSKDRLTVRQLAPGAIFDVGSSAIFSNSPEQQGALLAYLNSELATAMAHDLNPTINFQVGDLKKLVIPDFDQAEQARLSVLAASCVATKEKLFTISSALRFFQPLKPSLEVCLTEAACLAAQSDFNRLQNELISAELEIDRLVIEATMKDPALDQVDREAIHKFAARPKPKIPGSLAADKFCLNSLIEAMLSYFYSSSAAQETVIASLKDEADAHCFINFWPGTIDSSFFASQLDRRSAGLAQYIREDLPRLFDEVFMGQPALLLLAVEPQSIVVLPPQSLRCPETASILTECGQVSAQSKESFLHLLLRIRNIDGLDQMRAKDLVREIALLKSSDRKISTSYSG